MTGRRHRKAPKHKDEWDGNVYGLSIVGVGGTGTVFAIDEARVVKIPAGSDISTRAFRREREAFRILGREARSKFLLTCLEYHIRDRLILERCKSTVRERLQLQASECSSNSPRWDNSVFMKSSVTWACQAAEGLFFVHSKGIVHADVGCHNMLLDADDNVKISDFSGSGIRKESGVYLPALVSYDERSRKPGASESNVDTDIFALGSAIYELATGHLPYSDLPDSRVTSLFNARKWPGDLDSIRAAIPVMCDTIIDCWEGEYRSMEEVLCDFREAAIHEDNRDPDIGSEPEPEPQPEDDAEFLSQSTCSTTSSSSDQEFYLYETVIFDDNFLNEKYLDPPMPSRKKRTSKKKRQSVSVMSQLWFLFRNLGPKPSHPRSRRVVKAPAEYYYR